VSRDRQSYVLDSFALLAYFSDEPGREPVMAMLHAAEAKQADIYLSTVNYGEVVYITERMRDVQYARVVIAALDQLPITLVDVDRTMALEAAHLKARFSMSYADAFAVALAQLVEGILVTGDPEFRTVEHLISLQWLPQRHIDQ
jgi:ribonuclease VapC